MRLIDADSLIDLVTDSTILGDGFKTAFCALVNGEPTAKVQKTEKWIQEVKEMYQKAVNLPYIKKPLAWALYQVWKKHDKEDTSRRTDNE